MTPSSNPSSNRERSQLRPDDWRHLLPVGALVAAALGTLALGAILRAPEETTGGGEPLVIETTPAAEPLIPPPTAEEVDATAIPSEAEADDLERRARESRRQLAARDAWTLQFMVTCREDSAQRIVAELSDDPHFHLLPLLHNDQPCFRICWGDFASRDEAVSSRDLPAMLLALNPEPIPRLTADLIP